MVFCRTDARVALRAAGATDAVAIARKPIIRRAGDVAESGNEQEHSNRPQPPHAPAQHAKRVHSREHASVCSEQVHPGHQRRLRNAESRGGAGCLQRKTVESPRRQPASHSLSSAGTDATRGIVEDPAAHLPGVSMFCNFRNHRNMFPKKFQPSFNSFETVTTSLTTLTTASVGQARSCSYQELVISKNPASSRRRCSAYSSVALSFSASAMHSRNTWRGGSISRRFRSSSTMRNRSHGSFNDSKCSRLSPSTWTSFTILQPWSSLRLVLTFDRATPSVEAM